MASKQTEREHMGKFNKRQEYLPEGKHTVTITGAEIQYGDDARPPWATKSVKFMFTNDEGVAFWDCELEPLQTAGGQPNDTSREIGGSNVENMGCEFSDEATEDNAAFAAETEAFVMSGAPLGATVEINITGKDSDEINPKNGQPYRNRYLYVNRLIDVGAGGTTSNATEVATF